MVLMSVYFWSKIRLFSKGKETWKITFRLVLFIFRPKIYQQKQPVQMASWIDNLKSSKFDLVLKVLEWRVKVLFKTKFSIWVLFSTLHFSNLRSFGSSTIVHKIRGEIFRAWRIHLMHIKLSEGYLAFVL